MREVEFTVTLRLTYTKTDEELEKYYDTLDLTEAAEIDRRNYLEYPEFLTEDISQNGRPYTVEVETKVISE